MSNDLITDKGVFDTVWCPVMWMNELENPNRLKPSRDYDPLQSIHHALSVGTSTKWTFIQEVEGGRKALPYGESFWLHIPFPSGKFLLTAHEVTWAPMIADQGIVTVLRKRRYDPRDQEAYDAESHLQILMIQHLLNFFPRLDQARVTSVYPTWPEQSMSEPTSSQVDEAEKWADYIYAQKEGDVELVARHEKCPHCWWHQCPSRVITPAVEGMVLGQGRYRKSGVME